MNARRAAWAALFMLVPGCFAAGFEGCNCACDAPPPSLGDGNDIFFPEVGPPPDVSWVCSCGDGVLCGAEECEFSNLSGNTCQSFGFTGGSLGCSPECTFDTSGCAITKLPPRPRDMNGDGYDDLVIGTCCTNDPSLYGRAYIAFGGPGPELVTIAGMMEAEEPNDRFGHDLATGDLNGDGFTDVIVGAHRNDEGGLENGRIYIYFGGMGGTFDTNADLVITGWLTTVFLGAGLEVADVNGDGYDDLLAGAPGFSPGGIIYLFAGGPGLDATPDYSWEGDWWEDMGHNIAAGDLNGDGFIDLAFGIPAADVAGLVNTGKVYIHLGEPGGPDNVADAELLFEHPMSQFGGQLAMVGDVNGDGFGDLLVGAPTDSSAAPDAGRIRFYFGGPGMTFDSTWDRERVGGSEEMLGIWVEALGDINGDGWPDVGVGRRLGDSPAPYEVQLLFGGPGFDTGPDLTLWRGVDLDLFGLGMIGARDLDGDGWNDLAIGSPTVATWPQNPGQVHIYRGGPGILDDIADAVLESTDLDEHFGGPLATLWPGTASGPGPTLRVTRH